MSSNVKPRWSLWQLRRTLRHPTHSRKRPAAPKTLLSQRTRPSASEISSSSRQRWAYAVQAPLVLMVQCMHLQQLPGHRTLASCGVQAYKCSSRRCLRSGCAPSRVFHLLAAGSSMVEDRRSGRCNGLAPRFSGVQGTQGHGAWCSRMCNQRASGCRQQYRLHCHLLMLIS
jgi:hypothetical protein